MIQSSLTGLGILLIICTWHYSIRPALLDRARDQLFDLRDDMRAEFLRRDPAGGLEHPLYLALRKLLNGHLRYTESASILSYIASVRWIERNSDEAAYFFNRRSKVFEAGSPELQEYAANVRNSAASIMMSYMIWSSGFFATLIVVMVTLMLAKKLLWICIHGKHGRGGLWAFLQRAGQASFISLMKYFAPTSGENVGQQALEERAFQSA